MAPHVERLPAKQNSIGAEVLRDLFRVESVKLLAVFPVKQRGVFCLEQPDGRRKGRAAATLVEAGNSPADRHGVEMLRAPGEIGSRNHRCWPSSAVRQSSNVSSRNRRNLWSPLASSQHAPNASKP